jgi:hypothetical protein
MQLNRTSTQTNSGSNSGSGARVMLLRQQQQLPQAQQQDETLLRHDSSDVLITNLSLDEQAAQEAVTIAGSIADISSATTKGSSETNAAAKALARPSVDAGTVGTGEPAVKHKAETWLVSPAPLLMSSVCAGQSATWLGLVSPLLCFGCWVL